MAEARKDGCELRPGTAGFLVSDGKEYIAIAYSTTLQINVYSGWM